MPRTSLGKTRAGVCRLFLLLLAGCALVVTCKAIADVPAPPTGNTVVAPDVKPFVQQLPGTKMSFKMLPIPAGQFKMGSPATEKGHKPDEAPQIDVKMDAFYMGEAPVTWDLYSEFLSNYQRLANAKVKPPKVKEDQYADAITYPTPMYDMEAGPALQRMGGKGPKYPAVIMSQFAARQFTKWLSYKTGRFYRLPTEAEWEYACRAGTSTAYSFGDDPKKLGDYAWFSDNSSLSDGDTGYHPVATKKPNPWGLYDMHGNVSNWCIDQYDKDWYKKFAGKTVSWHDVINWGHGATRYPRVYRGGNYDAEATDCRSAARQYSSKDLNKRDPQVPKSPYWQTEGFMLGFRLVSPIQEPAKEEKLKCWEPDDDSTRADTKRDRDWREILPQGPAPDKK